MIPILHSDFFFAVTVDFSNIVVMERLLYYKGSNSFRFRFFMAARKTTSIGIKVTNVLRNANIQVINLFWFLNSKRWIFNFLDSFSKRKEKLTTNNIVKIF